MSPAIHEFIRIDLAPMLAGLLAAVACGLLGNFLVLRRLSLMGDAISHAVLPGIVAAFILAQSRNPLVMLCGAAAAGLLTVVLVEVVKRLGRVEPGAAMGVVFSVLFALGVLMIEQAARHVDLDADCVLYGNLENVTWWGASDQVGAYLRWETYVGTFDESLGRRINGIPPQVPILAAAVLAVALFMLLFFKELRIAAFDPGLASSLGINAGAMHVALMTLVAVATVAAFEAVGSILVIAMLICPAATARLLTERLHTQVFVSVIFAATASVGGYLLAAFGPETIGLGAAVNAAGMMAVVAGLLLVIAILLSPSHGLIAQAARRASLGLTVLREDLLALLYRAEESTAAGHTIAARAAKRAIGGGVRASLVIQITSRLGEIDVSNGAMILTDRGRKRAASIIRSHRLWETYLVREVGLRPDHVHDTAMILEHLRDRTGRLAPTAGDIAHDPHQREIPPATDA